MSKKKVDIPIYQKVAIDLAQQIAKGTYPEGHILRGSSSLVSTYHVSSETIRRAIRVLEDVNIVESQNGKGICILSIQAAQKYVERFTDLNTVYTYHQEIKHLLTEKSKINQQLDYNLTQILDYMTRFSSLDLFKPISFEVTTSCKHIGKMIADISLWQNTGATLIGLKRNDTLFISPGPYIRIELDDILYLIGNPHVLEQLTTFMNA